MKLRDLLDNNSTLMKLVNEKGLCAKAKLELSANVERCRPIFESFDKIRQELVEKYEAEIKVDDNGATAHFASPENKKNFEKEFEELIGTNISWTPIDAKYVVDFLTAQELTSMKPLLSFDEAV